MEFYVIHLKTQGVKFGSKYHFKLGFQELPIGFLKMRLGYL